MTLGVTGLMVKNSPTSFAMMHNGFIQSNAQARIRACKKVEEGFVVTKLVSRNVIAFSLDSKNVRLPYTLGNDPTIFDKYRLISEDDIKEMILKERKRRKKKNKTSGFAPLNSVLFAAAVGIAVVFRDGNQQIQSQDPCAMALVCDNRNTTAAQPQPRPQQKQALSNSEIEGLVCGGYSTTEEQPKQTGSLFQYLETSRGPQLAMMTSRGHRFLPTHLPSKLAPVKNVRDVSTHATTRAQAVEDQKKVSIWVKDQPNSNKIDVVIVTKDGDSMSHEVLTGVSKPVTIKARNCTVKPKAQNSEATPAENSEAQTKGRNSKAQTKGRNSKAKPAENSEATPAEQTVQMPFVNNKPILDYIYEQHGFKVNNTCTRDPNITLIASNATSFNAPKVQGKITEVSLSANYSDYSVVELNNLIQTQQGESLLYLANLKDPSLEGFEIIRAVRAALARKKLDTTEVASTFYDTRQGQRGHTLPQATAEVLNQTHLMQAAVYSHALSNGPGGVDARSANEYNYPDHPAGEIITGSMAKNIGVVGNLVHTKTIAASAKEPRACPLCLAITTQSTVDAYEVLKHQSTIVFFQEHLEPYIRCNHHLRDQLGPTFVDNFALINRELQNLRELINLLRDANNYALNKVSKSDTAGELCAEITRSTKNLKKLVRASEQFFRHFAYFEDCKKNISDYTVMNTIMHFFLVEKPIEEFYDFVVQCNVGRHFNFVWAQKQKSPADIAFLRHTNRITNAYGQALEELESTVASLCITLESQIESVSQQIQSDAQQIQSVSQKIQSDAPPDPVTLKQTLQDLLANFKKVEPVLTTNSELFYSNDLDVEDFRKKEILTITNLLCPNPKAVKQRANQFVAAWSHYEAASNRRPVPTLSAPFGSIIESPLYLATKKRGEISSNWVNRGVTLPPNTKASYALDTGEIAPPQAFLTPQQQQEQAATRNLHQFLQANATPGLTIITAKQAAKVTHTLDTTFRQLTLGSASGSTSTGLEIDSGKPRAYSTSTALEYQTPECLDNIPFSTGAHPSTTKKTTTKKK